MNRLPVVISCEHAGNQVPAAYRHLFAHDPEVLYTHRGWDIGALAIARYISLVLDLPLFYENTSRLLIEMNRSLDNPFLFSAYCERLTDDQKQLLIEDIYQPYRQQVIDALEQTMQLAQPVLHYSIHTFTPVLGNDIRKTDIGILFDPASSTETRFALAAQQYLAQRLPNLQIDLNLPYAGIEDGFTTFLRKVYPSEHYCGIEIEVNQKYMGSSKLPDIKKYLTETVCHFYQYKN